jgi:hypothetical protein
MSGSLFATSVSIFVTQRLSAFRSCVATAYRLCYASRFSAESSEPSSKEFLRHSLLPVSAAFTAPNRSASTTMLTSCRRPDAPVRRLWRLCFYSWVCACSRRTFLPRPNVSASLACRALRACLLYYLCQAVVTAIAVTPSCPKQQRPT